MDAFGRECWSFTKDYRLPAYISPYNPVIFPYC